MKNYKILVIIMFASLFCFYDIIEAQNTRKIPEWRRKNNLIEYDTDLFVSSYKDVYYLGEEICIEIRAYNYDKHGPQINGHITNDLQIINSQGRHYHPNTLFSVMDAEPMKKNEERKFYVDILTDYGESSDSSMGFMKYLPVDTYKISAFWWNQSIVPLESDTLEIKVIEPQGIEKQAYNLYLDLKEAYWYNRYSLFMEKCDELVFLNPVSVYVPDVLSSKLTIVRCKTRQVGVDEIYKISRFILEKHPYSYYTVVAIFYMNHFDNDQFDRDQYFKELYNKTQSQKLKYELKKYIHDRTE